ncbi:Myrosinase 1, partial [Trichostrongylus colubriformis]
FQVTHYRLSICWTRILPTGLIDNINEKGVLFYRDLLEELIKNDISPIVTLFHADYPYSLYEKGGWLNSDCIQWYHDFCRLCFVRFGDLVQCWITFNEIGAHAWWAVTKIDGQLHHSPDTVDIPIPKRKAPYVAAHNMLLAHARVYHMYVQEFRKNQRGQLGITVGGRWYKTFSEDSKDDDAVKRALDWTFNWTVAPIFGKDGDYPDSLKRNIRELEKRDGLELLPRFTEEEMEQIKGTFSDEYRRLINP